MSLEQMTLVME